MDYCVNCGNKIDSKIDTFCGKCGITLQSNSINQTNQESSYTQDNQPHPTNNQYNYQQQYPVHPYYQNIPRRTTALTIIVVLNWIGIGFLIIIGLIFILFIQIFNSMSGNRSGEFDDIIIVIIGIFVVIVALLGYLNYHLNRFSNMARVTQLIISGLGLVSIIYQLINGYSFSYISLYHVFVIYVLGFDENTKKLFQSS